MEKRPFSFSKRLRRDSSAIKRRVQLERISSSNALRLMQNIRNRVLLELALGDYEAHYEKRLPNTTRREIKKAFQGLGHVLQKQAYEGVPIISWTEYLKLFRSQLSTILRSKEKAAKLADFLLKHRREYFKEE